MKKLFVALSLFLIATFVHAQTLSKEMQEAFDACQQLSSAIGAGDNSGLADANKRLKACAVSPFSSLRYTDEEPLSLDGHFVFDNVFVDSLIAGRDVYKFAQRYAEVRGVRGASTSGKVFTKTCAVRASSSTKLTFPSRGHQELAFVTEPSNAQGHESRITVRIHDLTHDKWYNDTQNVKKGQPTRTFTFDLPASERTQLEVEVINCGKNDCSFVVISN